MNLSGPIIFHARIAPFFHFAGGKRNNIIDPVEVIIIGIK